MPASNSWRENGLAGATTAIRSPRRSARGLRMRLGEPGHFGGDRLMLVASEEISQGAPLKRARARRGRRRQEAFLHPAVTRESILDALQRQRSVLHGVDDRLERGGLRLLGGAAQ